MTADQALLRALEALVAALRETGAPAMIVGGIAVIARGVPRHTVDIDATIWAEDLPVDRLLAVLAAHRIVSRIADPIPFARARQVLLLRHEPSGTPLEVILASLPFEREALGRATPVDFNGVVAPVATAEDLVVYKAVAWRPRDQDDIERLLVLHGRAMNLARVREVICAFAEALEEPERVPAFDAVVERALGQG
jgi:hypothetical protein